MNDIRSTALVPGRVVLGLDVADKSAAILRPVVAAQAHEHAVLLALGDEVLDLQLRSVVRVLGLI